MSGNTPPIQVPITRQLFNRYLSEKPLHHYFAEDAGMLMKQMRSAYPPSDTRARTYGFVTPTLSADEQRAVLAFLLSPRLTAEINPFGKVALNDHTVVNYVHIILRNVARTKPQTVK